MDVCLQARIAIQVVVLGDALAVREDLRSLGVFFGGDVPVYPSSSNNGMYT